MKKKFIYSLSSLILAGSLLGNANTHAAENESVNESKKRNNITLIELNEIAEIQSAQLKGNIYTAEYKKNEELYSVIYNGNTGHVTINGEIQTDVTYEYDPALALNNPSTSTNTSQTGGISTFAAAPKTGYSYVGTLKGHTKESKNAAYLATQLALLIPGAGYTVNTVKVLLVFGGYNFSTSERIPSKYYKYDLYQKGFMTSNWYQYSTVRLYNDSNYKKPAGNSWTSKAEKIYLPNS